MLSFTNAFLLFTSLGRLHTFSPLPLAVIVYTIKFLDRQGFDVSNYSQFLC